MLFVSQVGAKTFPKLGDQYSAWLCNLRIQGRECLPEVVNQCGRVFAVVALLWTNELTRQERLTEQLDLTKSKVRSRTEGKIYWLREMDA